MFTQDGHDFPFGGEEEKPFAEDFFAVEPDGEFAAVANEGFGRKAELLLNGRCRPGSQSTVTASTIAVAYGDLVHCGIVTQGDDGGNNRLWNGVEQSPAALWKALVTRLRQSTRTRKKRCEWSVAAGIWVGPSYEATGVQERRSSEASRRRVRG